MKTTNALVAAALAGVFAAGTTATKAAQLFGSPTAAETEKEKCDGKDKDKCTGKDKDKCPAKEKEKAGTNVSNEAEKDKEKDKCDGKDGCPGKEKKKAGTIL